LNREHFNVTELISNTIQDVSSQSQKANNGKLKLVFYNHHDENNNQGIIIDADKARITQVLLNLLTNAIKFTEEGTISIKLQATIENNKDDSIIVSIKDTGDGIDPEVMPRLFTKFASKCSEGTGLGLYISKSIVEAHGGKIWAENNNSGDDDAGGKRRRGATFHFTLPVVNESSSSVNQAKQQRQDADNNHCRRI
jgi:signal transduction histidine kinase